MPRPPLTRPPRWVPTLRPEWTEDVCWVLARGEGRRVLYTALTGRTLTVREFLRSTCTEQFCYNPSHLVVTDWSESSRHRTVGVSPIAKLTIKQVEQIRLLWWSGCATQVQLAAEYGVSQPTVSSLLSRECWKWLKPALVEEIARPQFRNAKGKRPLPLCDLEHPEYDQPLNTGTGRLIGPTGEVYNSVRHAEVCTGLDRLVLARELLKGQEWKYEQGPAPAVLPGW